MSSLTEWLWLSHLLGYGAKNSGEVLSLYGSPAELLQAVGKEDLSGLLSPAQQARLDEKPERFEALAEKCRRMGVRILTMDDPDYPDALRGLEDAPPVLYCTGQPEVLNRMPCVGMIGSRRPSSYGVDAARMIGGGLARKGVCIVSGLADGLDGCCHRAAVENGAPTVGVLGTSIDRTYPANNADLRRKLEENGAVLSEYAPGVHTNSSAFLQRNRLIAGLSQAVCVVEAREKSGTMNTVGHAGRYGRPVFAVPGTIFSELCAGTNQLLEEGIARASASAAPILVCLGIDPGRTVSPARKPGHIFPTKLSPEAQALLDKMGQTALSAEQLAAAVHSDMASVLAALLELELSGRIEGCAGGQYRRK